ncbi:Rcas_1661 family thioredoxin-like (seleno)lipoprotein [Chloroflexus sp.]|uniref:Rcas_1661 family thioredoxin-like (seleno)lipoprotein n=1 Tax=Chloroflexus sp. TaxID=1904827 RepID=UPI00404A346F
MVTRMARALICGVVTMLVACTVSAPVADMPSPTAVVPTLTPSALPTSTTAPTVAAPTAALPTVTAVPATTVPMVTYRGTLIGRDANGAYTLGDPAAPLTLTDYSDFLCPVCRRHVLTVEPALIERYVVTRRVLYVFRPVLNHGAASLITTAAAFCAGEQDAFWLMHELIFERQSEVAATRDSDGAVQRLAETLDAEQRQRGIRVQPVFEIGDVRLVGLQILERFASLIERQP